MRRLFGNKSSAKTRDKTSDMEYLDIAGIFDAMQCFPLGKKIRHFPEFQTHLTLDSIIIAYCINNIIVFSHKDIRFDVISDRDVLFVHDNDKEQQFKRVTGFSIIIPDNTDDNSKLDYIRKAEIGRTAFRRGNNITLMAANMDRGIPQIDTTVKKIAILKDSHYKNHKVVLLDAMLDTLVYIDQRQHPRVKTWIPAAVSIADSNNPIRCHCSDFSERSVQLKIDAGNTLPGRITDSTEAIMTVQLDNTLPPVTIKGNILRKNTDAIVVTLDKILKDQKFTSLDMIERLAIKTNLLQHPRTEHV